MAIGADGNLKLTPRPVYNPAQPEKSHPAEHRMAVERTLSIIKPDATARNQTGAVNALIEKAGLRIIAQKRVRWTQAQPRNSTRCTRRGPSTATSSAS